MAITAAAAAVKIIVQLHEGDVRTTKIWRFEQGKVYSKDDLCTEVKKLFPRIVQKGLAIKLHHQDDMAGSILIDSDEDVQEALTNFIEESQGETRKEYLTLHAQDCMPIERKEVEDLPSKPASRKVILLIVRILFFTTHQ